ncbi:hypothetical protein AOQ84DRAFT_301534 [Glonium stellatum]|uniref:Protein transport protein sec16 n=1 Tax=Glonium stellatum TaxID=574774 RepID=A0A8E2JNU2_9PEZI|nr:hypothetical protein AOQ84DRAFT_301534 [Glonium stellatum]
MEAYLSFEDKEESFDTDEKVGEEEHPPSEHYEHQSESTFLEDAIHDDGKVPLVGDLEPASLDWGNPSKVFDLGGKERDGPLSQNRAEDPISDAFGKVQKSANEESNAPKIDWGTSVADEFNLGDATKSLEDTIFNGNSVAGATGGGAQPVQDGLDDVWKAALQDDDFLPDTEESAGAFFVDDGEGFLEDAPTQPVQEAPQATQYNSIPVNKYAPAAAQSKPAATTYGVSAPQFTDFSQLDQRKPTSAPAIAYGAYNQPLSYQQQTVRPAIPNSAQSFADKAKGGYSSPFDLPEDIVKPRRRPAPHHVTVPSVQPTPPPPRSSSLYSNTSAGAIRPPPTSNMSAASLSPPSSSHSMQSPMGGIPLPASQQSHPTPKSSSSDFFAELPIVSKPRHHAPPSGRYTPQNTVPTPPPSNYPTHIPKDRTGSWSSQTQETQPYTPPLISQLQPPERLPAFPDLTQPPTRSNSLPIPPAASISSRYSPAPPSVPAASSRYSPAPPTVSSTGPRYSPAPPQAPSGPSHSRYASEPAGPPRPQAQPFAPRTSSPLAFHTLPQDQPEPAPSGTQSRGTTQEFTHHAMHSADGIPRAPLRRPLEEVSELEEQEQVQGPIGSTQSSRPPVTTRSATPPLRSSPSSTVGSPRKRVQSNYTPQYQPGPPPPMSNVAPPRRSQSQSPGAIMKNPIVALTSMERPATAHDPTSPSSGSAGQNVASIIPHRRSFSREFDFIAPTDERATDPLSRWKGYPIFKWGLGGTVLTSFPKHIPRYGAGGSVPMMKCSPGEVRIQNVKEVYPLEEDIARFPGPLKAKGKKKDVTTWLGGKIASMEKELQSPGLDRMMSQEKQKRLEEKTLLWKVMQTFVEHDGRLEGSPAAEQAIRKILSPNNTESPDASSAFATGSGLIGIPRSSTSNVQAEPVDPRAVDELRNLLTRGDREKAVWHAVDQRLWAHAMLLSSTLDKSIWKQVVQEFVRKEVKRIGGNTQALAVLYEIFAGNWDDCIDELVPASARAGFQMVSTDGNGSTNNVLQGLDRWRETLLLVLSNRSEGDVQALTSLGRLLGGYGRIEAAHICYMFARSSAHLGGVDDPQSDVVLIGADHRNTSLDVGRDVESILLTEVYEFALSLSASNSAATLPHLQTYKLAHAYTLAEFGYRNEAQQYCDAIAAAIKSTTRLSPYYNGSFITVLDDLSKRLSQSPKDGSSSWISKPSMDKVSGTLLAKFNSFIAGDDSDATSNHSGNGTNEVGPFAKIAGNTPTISPSHSNADLYGAYNNYAGSGSSIHPAGPSMNSRYAPASGQAPRSSLDQARSRYDPQAQSAYQPSRPSMESSDGSLGYRRGSDNYIASPQLSSPYTPTQYSPPAHRAQAPRSQSLVSPHEADTAVMHSSYGIPYQSGLHIEQSAQLSGYQPESSFNQRPASPISAPDGSSASYEPPSNGYEPPTSSYEPPTYQPYSPNDTEDSSPVVEKKKSLMDDDDDDDLARRAAELKKKQKSEADRQADEAFRKAAETDAAKSKEGPGDKKGWFGGWFKKDPNAAPGPIKAKLGEENSFYYDPELKKWINKKGGGASAPTPTLTPPPPKSGPPSRSVSGNSVVANHALGQLGSSLPHSMLAPPSRPPTSNPQRSSSMPPPSGPGSRAVTPPRSDTPGPDSDKMAPPLMPPNLPPSGPPSRPSTGMSNASSIEDLIGAPQARKGGTVKKGKRTGRYVDVMATK